MTDPARELTGDPAIGAALAAAWCARNGVAPPATWERTYGRRAPGGDAGATIVLEGRPEAPGRPVVLALTSPAGADGPEVFDGGAAGQVAVLPFDGDPGLPGLREALAGLDATEVLRYRPGKRCTVRARLGGRTVIVKAAPAAVHVWDDAVVLWEAALAGRLPFAVAEPVRWDGDRGIMVQGLVAGRPILDDVRSAGGPALTRRLGEALAGLARSRVVPTATAPPDAQIARTDRAVARAAARVPHLADRLRAQADRLRRAHAALAPAMLVPCHGAAHVHQWLADGDRLGLIDFDRFAMGEPELDVATYIAELETERGMAHDAGVHEAAMLAGFADGGVPLDPRRVRLHRDHKRLAKITRTAIALRPDAAERCESLLARIEAAAGD